MSDSHKIKALIFSIAICALLAPGRSKATEDTLLATRKNGEISKLKDIVIYKDSSYFSSFPSVIKNDDGGWMVAFRRAPERRLLGEQRSSHVDPNSYLVAVRSRDGETWTKNPELIFAHPYGGSQDPCLLKLRDGTILCAGYTWSFVRPEGIGNLRKPILKSSLGGVLSGGFILRSANGGKDWQGPFVVPHVKQEVYNDAFGDPLPAYNRGAIYEGKNGQIFWSVAVHDTIPVAKTSNHLLVSGDKGLTWQHRGIVATDDKISFNEASMYETPKGDLVAFLRTADYDDQACIARSTDGGKTFKWTSMGFQGHPCHALRLTDNRVLLTYGYRHKPYGIRARILNAECTDFATAKEFVIREDGGSMDVGYIWSVNIDGNKVLIVYYLNIEDGTRFIAGSIIETD